MSLASSPTSINANFIGRTVFRSGNNEYPKFVPPHSLQSMSVTAFTKTWTWMGNNDLIEWLEFPLRWPELKVLSVQMTPLRNFGHKSLTAILEPDPWRRLGHCLLCKDRFPTLKELAIVLIQDGTTLINWEEEKDWAEGIDNVSYADAIVDALNVDGTFVVNISKGNVILEDCC